MPHYVVQLDDEDEGLFALYSTIVDNLLTEPMSAEEMRAHLEGKGGYETWFQPYDAEQVIAKWYANGSDGMKSLMRDNARYMHYHEGVGLCYVKQTDSYFTLPRELWRNE